MLPLPPNYWERGASLPFSILCNESVDNQTLAQRPVSQAQSKRRPQLTEKTDNILWMKKLESLSQVTQVFDAKKSFKENCQVSL